MILRLKTCLLLLGLVVSVAQADSATAVLVPPHVESGIADSVVTRAVGQLRRELERSPEHYSVIPYAQAAAFAEADQADRFEKPKGEPDAIKCVSSDCAVWFRRVVNADIAVQLSIFNKVDANNKLQPSSLKIILVKDAEARWSGSSDITTSVEDAVTAAYEQAVIRSHKGVGPWISVVGSPEGAGVYLDGERIGQMPIERHRVEDAGSMHILTVKYNGYQDHNQPVELRGDISREELIEIDLQSVTGEAKFVTGGHHGKDAGSSGHAKLADRIVGTALLAAGVAHLAAGAFKWSREDECAQRQMGQCTEFYGDKDDSYVPKVMVGAGIAGVALGAAFWTFNPIYRVSARAHKGSASLTVEGRF